MIQAKFNIQTARIDKGFYVLTRVSVNDHKQVLPTYYHGLNYQIPVFFIGYTAMFSVSTPVQCTSSLSDTFNLKVPQQTRWFI